MSIHHAPPAGRPSNEESWNHPDDGWDADPYDEAYDDVDPGRVLWGRVAVFCALMLSAFLMGRLTAGGDDDVALAEAEQQVEQLTAELEQARSEIDALAAVPRDPGGDAAADTAADASGDEAPQPADADDTADDAASAAAAEDASDADDAAAAEDAGPTQTYTVEAGDNLFGLAERFLGDGQQWRLIAEANGMPADAVLTPGQTLEIPTP